MMVRNLNFLKLRRKLRRNLLLENSQEKEKINPAIFKKEPYSEKNPTSRRIFRSALQSRSTTFSNSMIRKFQVNSIIRKHHVFKLHDQEILGQPYNKKTPRN
jgi:hypothetical protein